MRNDKEIALNLRKEGKSYKNIGKLLHIPKSTLSNWFSNLEWSDVLKKNLIEKTKSTHVAHLKDLTNIRNQNLRDLYDQAREEAVKEFHVLKSNPLFIASLMIYWGEGDKRSKYRCSVSNSESDMLRLFLLFLERICGVKKFRIKAWILAYPETDQGEALEFWSKNIGLSKDNFTKTIVILGKQTNKKLPHGVCYVTVGSAYLKIKILSWIRLLSGEIIKFSE
ncbi:MAG: hypothetical protein Q7R72_02590 [bacterium]|nr:hypothetical protein [bacterium]